MSKATLKKRYEAQLLAQRERLLEELSHEPATLTDGRPGYSTHMADDATDVFEQAKSLALRQDLQRDLEMIELALEKLRKGTYGICERCHEPIAPDRLEAMPQVRYCVSCQQILEKAHRPGA